jgi:hypothetical protein
MAFILYHPNAKHIETGQRLYAAKGDGTTDRWQNARVFDSLEEAAQAAIGPYDGFVAQDVFHAHMWIMLIGAIRRTWDVLAERAFDSFKKQALTAQEVRSYLCDYIDNNAGGNYAKTKWWDPLSDKEKTNLLAEAVPEGEYSREGAEE